MSKGQYITNYRGWTIRLYNTRGGASYIATKLRQQYKIDESLAALKNRITTVESELNNYEKTP